MEHETIDISPCQDHWDELREAIKEQGLEALIPEDGDSAMSQLARRMEEGGKATIDNFDPLTGAYMEIVRNLMRMAGVWDGCPICFVEKNSGCDCGRCGWSWIDQAATSQLEQWQKIGE